MQFGQVDEPGKIDFTLPKDDPKTKVILSKSKNTKLKVYVGCAKWNKSDLKNFYPRGTKDELAYYATQFNSIELNATFYHRYPREQFEKWRDKTPKNFRFFPKITQDISHLKRLNNIEPLVKEYVHNVSGLEEKLGMVFLQMHNNFAPKDMDRVIKFVEQWPKGVPLAIEFRHTDWYNDPKISSELYTLLEKNKISTVLVDTAGRRDLLHMRLTTPCAFVRYVGANHKSDYSRMDEWLKRIETWKEQGLKELYFFVHQNVELESPLLSAYFITKLNKKLGTDLIVPQTLTNTKKTPQLFNE
jgi:uncharacterized protein YecE (DUF72 family)